MGLVLVVGVDAADQHSDEAQRIRTERAQLARVLRRQGIEVPPEPSLTPEQALELELWSYSGLHRLRRVAAHVGSTGRLPGPGDEGSAEDAVLQELYACWPPAAHVGFVADPVPFEQLIMHNDAHGWYVIVDLPGVFYGPPELVPAGAIGSVPRLAAECAALADALEVPPRLAVDSRTLHDALAGSSPEGRGWRAYAVETLTCLQLLDACEHSVRTGASVLFF